MHQRAKPSLWVPGAVPLLLIGVGLLHSVVGLTSDPDTVRGMMADGLWGTLSAEPWLSRRTLLLWFLLSGFFLILIGHLGLWIERCLNEPLPLFFAVEFLAVSMVTLIVHGGSAPGWIFVAAGVWMLAVRLAARRRHGG